MKIKHLLLFALYCLISGSAIAQTYSIVIKGVI